MPESDADTHPNWSESMHALFHYLDATVALKRDELTLAQVYALMSIACGIRAIDKRLADLDETLHT